MNLLYWLIKVKSFSKQCVNKDIINTVLNIFYLFRFFTYWNELSFLRRKNTLTAVCCCLLCIADCVGTLVSTVLLLVQTKSKSSWISTEKASALPVCGGWRCKAKPVTTVGKKSIQPWERPVFLEALFLILICCIPDSFLHTLQESTGSAIY